MSSFAVLTHNVSCAVEFNVGCSDLPVVLPTKTEPCIGIKNWDLNCKLADRELQVDKVNFYGAFLLT